MKIDAKQMDQTIADSVKAFQVYKKVSRLARSLLLKEIADGIAAKRADFITVLGSEAGKPILLADIEVNRAIVTFTYASEEAKRFVGELLPMDIEVTARNFDVAQVLWVPRGPIYGITPFNFPLNLVAHKVAPALAAGASILIKAAPQAPTAAMMLKDIFNDAAQSVSKKLGEEIPKNTFQAIMCSNEVAEIAVVDKRMTVLSFTGSHKVGFALQRLAVEKKVSLELGGNAAVVICADADLKKAANRCASGGFAYAGQSCISVQRIFIQKNVYAEFCRNLLEETAKVKVGMPNEAGVMVGPVIDQKAADRIMSWIDEAVKAGAKVLIGGKRNGNIIEPTILENVPKNVNLSCEEVFGPLVVVESFADIDEAINQVNSSKFGLQAGVFSDSKKILDRCISDFEVGGVLINEVPTYRADHMPYGGVKESGLGREGLKYAMEEFSERKVVVSFKNMT
jgi:acyl-CoA reductase-like NAD-dependent aldehyde dehydrogenase